MPSRTLTPDPPAAPGLHAPPASRLRLITVPAGWPPYDCETHGATCPVAREAATSNPDISSQPPGRAEQPGPTVPSPAPGQDRPPDAPASAASADTTARDDTAVRASTAPGAAGQGGAGQGGAGQATALPRQFAQVIVEILAGSRPLRQTVGWTTDRVRAQIGDLTQVLASDQRPRIRRIVMSQPAASVVEMTVVVSFGPRSRALAVRFEHVPARRPAPGLPARPARWVCTEIETGLPAARGQRDRGVRKIRARVEQGRQQFAQAVYRPGLFKPEPGGGRAPVSVGVPWRSFGAGSRPLTLPG